MKIYSSLFLSILTLSGFGMGEASLAAAGRTLSTAKLLETGQPVKIVCFGDSITGVYYPTGGRRAWCDMLGIALHRIYPQAKIEMINAGISGHTTSQALARMDADVLRHHPQLVVVMFGMNDVVNNATGVSPEIFRANLAQIVKRARAQGGEVILMTPNSIYSDDPRRAPWYLTDYVEIVRQVGKELEVPVTDCFRTYEAVRSVNRWAWVRLMSDSLHPNMRGHKVFAEEVAWTISGKRVSLADVPLLQPGLPRVLSRLRAQQPVKVIAMKPYDSLIGPALQSLFPGAQIQVTTWDANQKSLASIEAA